MFSPQDAMLIALFLPVIAMFLIMLTGKMPNVREGLNLIFAVGTFALVLSVASAVAGGARPEAEIFEIFPGLSIHLKAEPLGAMFAVIASGLFIVNSCYSIGYMRSNNEKNQTRFYMCFAVAIAAALGIAFAGNLLTFFAFYELLTLSTFPLVTHKGDLKAQNGGRIYLGILVGTSIGLLLPAVIWTFSLTGTTEFVLGGILGDAADFRGFVPPLLLAMFAFGIGKAALMPFHPWLPNAMVAPTPVSAFLHAVAVVKAGVFGVLKVATYTFGIDTIAGIGGADIIMWVAAGSIIIASAIAMTQDNLKARLAYSTVSQLSYVTLGAMMATRLGVMGGATQIAAHALGKMTLFMCAGAIYTALHKSFISEMRGTGRQMPWTWTAYIIGACSIIGLPPMAGSWPKFYLMLGAVDRGTLLLLIVLIISSLMNIVYLLTPAVRAFMDPPPNAAAASGKITEAPLFCLVPAWTTAIGTILLFFFMGSLVTFLEPILGGAS